MRGQTGKGQFPRDAKALADVVVEVLRAGAQTGADALPELVGL